VPFPTNEYGEYVGYKTDHDPYRRATSAGPYTSKLMTQALEKSVRAKNIPIFDRMQAIELLVEEGRIAGLLCLDLDHAEDENRRYAAFRCANIVWATGGPAGMYFSSVYPASQYGATGVAFRAGALGRNLTEWQFGLASLNPRWNVSGTYMQCLPRFISTDADGNDAREFLPDSLSDVGEMLTMEFLKGYQWPFDVRKARDGSSRIDLLVHQEMQRGRRIFGHGGSLLSCPFYEHCFQFIGLRLGQFFRIAKLFAAVDQLLGAFGQLQFFTFQFKYAAQQKHRIFGRAKNIAQLTEIPVGIGCRVQVRHFHHTAGTKKGNGARRHDHLFQFRRRTIQYRGLCFLLKQTLPHRRQTAAHQIPLGRIKIKHRAALLQQLIQFLFAQRHRSAPTIRTLVCGRTSMPRPSCP